MYVLILSLLLVKICLAVDYTITAGVDIPWTIQESERSPQRICFTCSVPVKIVSINPVYCSSCFDAWQEDSTNCLYYIPRTSRLDHSRASSYAIRVSCEETGTPVVTNVNLGVMPNFPPSYTESDEQIISLNVDLTSGSLVKQVAYMDPDVGDVHTFSLTETPNNGFFRITNTGEIRAKKDLSTFCAAETVRISMTDGYNSPVYLTIYFDPGQNIPFVLKDWNRVTTYDENKQVVLYISDKLSTANSATCVVRSDPAGLSDLAGDLSMGYCPNGLSATSRITITSKTYNFEKDPPLNLTLQYNNGNCLSNTRWLYINWADVPEAPTLELDKPEYSANEGFIQVLPKYIIHDEDLNEKHTFKFAGTVNAQFSIDVNTGKIYTPKYLQATAEVNIYSFNVKIVDKDGLESNTVTVKIRVADINNHAPVLGKVPASYQATACTGPQKFLDVTATDQDFGINKQFKFVSSTSGSLFINEAGELYLIKPTIPGQRDELHIRAVDSGEPQLYSDPWTVTLLGLPCPTESTLPPPPQPTTVYNPPAPDPTTQPSPPPTTQQKQAPQNGADPFVCSDFFLLCTVLLTVVFNSYK